MQSISTRLNLHHSQATPSGMLSGHGRPGLHDSFCHMRWQIQAHTQSLGGCDPFHDRGKRQLRDPTHDLRTQVIQCVWRKEQFPALPFTITEGTLIWSSSMFIAAVNTHVPALWVNHRATPVAPSCFQNWIHVGGMETNTGNKAPRPADGAARKTRGGKREVVSAFLRASLSGTPRER